MGNLVLQGSQDTSKLDFFALVIVLASIQEAFSMPTRNLYSS